MSGDRPGPRGAVALVCLAVGWVIIAAAAVGVLRDADLPRWWSLPTFVVAFDLTHDLVVAPLVVAGGWVLGRVLPPVARGPVRTAAAMTALVVLFSWPSVQRFGERPTNSSALPLDYGTNVVVVVAVVWVVAAVVVAVRAVSGTRSRSRPPAGTSSPPTTPS